jgi:hypothetical protein
MIRRDYMKPVELSIDKQETGGAPHKPYTPPAIIHELEIETRAGSPLGGMDPLDFTGGE